MAPHLQARIGRDFVVDEDARLWTAADMLDLNVAGAHHNVETFLPLLVPYRRKKDRAISSICRECGGERLFQKIIELGRVETPLTSAWAWKSWSFVCLHAGASGPGWRPRGW